MLILSIQPRSIPYWTQIYGITLSSWLQHCHSISLTRIWQPLSENVVPIYAQLYVYSIFTVLDSTKDFEYLNSSLTSSNINLDCTITFYHSAILDHSITPNLSNSSPTPTLTLTLCKLKHISWSCIVSCQLLHSEFISDTNPDSDQT